MDYELPTTKEIESVTVDDVCVMSVNCLRDTRDSICTALNEFQPYLYIHGITLYDYFDMAQRIDHLEKVLLMVDSVLETKIV